MDSDFEFQLIIAFELFGVANMLVYGLEPALDVFILGLVEGLKVAGFCGGFIGGNGAIAVTFAGGVGTDEVQF